MTFDALAANNRLLAATLLGANDALIALGLRIAVALEAQAAALRAIAATDADRDLKGH
jgi:hypothetical protein